MSIVDYLIGVVLLTAVVGALAFGAVEARARWLPSWRGAPARLAEITGALVVVITIPELLGTVGLFRRWPVTLAVVAAGVGAGLIARHSAPRPANPATVTEDPTASGASSVTDADQGATTSSTVARATALGAAVMVGIVCAHWGAHVLASYRRGIQDGDSLWYHLPFAADFVQTGHTTQPLLTEPESLVAFFPANSEMLSGVTMLLFGRDVVVPMLSLVWLGLALLAGWCIGARYRAGAVGLVAVALLLDVPLMAATQAGTARNDAMAVALMLVVVALLVHADWDPVAVGLAGAANGLALGVKLSVVPMAALLTIGVVLIAPRVRRMAVAIPWLVTTIVFGSFWYVRNLARVGNPLPWLSLHLGPISIAKIQSEDKSDTAVVDRLTSGEGRDVLRHGLTWVFGPLWWVFLVAAIGIALAAAFAGRGRIARMLGVVAVLGFVGYVFTPNGAPVDVEAVGSMAAVTFGLNFRYIVHGVVLAVALVTTLRGFERTRVAAGAVAAALLLDVTLWSRRAEFERVSEWEVTDGERALAAGIAVLFVVVIAALALGPRTLQGKTGIRKAGRWIAAATAVVLLVGTYVLADNSLDHRYDDVTHFGSGRTWRWAEDLPTTRIAILGKPFQYPYVGVELANHVRFLGVKRDDGGLRSARSCQELRQELADGDFEYLVTSLDFGNTNREQLELAGGWVSAVPGTSVVFEGDVDTVYRLGRPMDPDACP